MKKIYLMCLGILLLGGLATAAYAQKTVTGTVKDPSGETLPAVSIQVKNTPKTTSTNADGNFSISVSESDILVFKYIGYKPKEVTVGTANNLTVMLESATSNLDEVVVTALGVKREKRALGYSTQSVAGKDLTIAQAPTIAQGLMGKVAGLQISQSAGGVEGGSARIVVRGNTSLTGDNRALVIVDGVAINNDPLNNNGNNNAARSMGLTQDKNQDVSSYKDWGTGMNFINQEDIEDVTVLKGPAAAALYGARGANGVILITRKKGGAKKGLGVDYSFSTRTTNPYQYMDFQNEYGAGLRSSMWTANESKRFKINGAGQRIQTGLWSAASGTDYVGGAFNSLPYNNAMDAWQYFSFPSALSWGPKFDGQPILWYDGVQRPYSAVENDWKQFFPNGFVRQHNVALSGGSDLGSLRFSYTRDESDANILNSNYNSNIFNLGSSVKVSNRLRAEVTGSYVNYTRLNTPTIGGGYGVGLAYGAQRGYDPAVEKLNDFKADGSQNDVNNRSNFPTNAPAYPFDGGYLTNSFWNIYKNNSTLNRNQFIGGAKVIADVTDWLTMIGQGGIDNSNDVIQVKNYPTNVQGTKGSYQEAQAKLLSRTITGFLKLHKDNFFLDQFNAALTLGGESYYRNDYTTSGRTRGDFIRPFIFSANNGNIAEDWSDYVPEIRYQKQINSTFGFLDLSYKNYLFLNVTGRNDWSSTLASNYNSYFYPSASLSYVFTDGIPKLQTALPWLSFGKLGLSFAETGSDTDPYTIYNLLNTSQYNGQASQTFPDALKYEGVKPQRSRNYELNLSLGFLKNRLNLTMSAYTMKTFNQILTSALPMSSGYSSIVINSGSIGNKGFEFTINATPIANKDFTWNIAVNGATSRSKVLALVDGINELQLGNLFGGYGISQRVKVGDNYGTIYGKDFKYLNGKKVVKDAVDNLGNKMTFTDPVSGKTYTAGTQWVLTDSEVPIGNSQPKLTGGISNTFSYKGFSLYTLVDAKIGGDSFFGTWSAAMGNGLLKETTKERDGGGLPLVYPDGSVGNNGIVFDGVYADGTPNTNVVNPAWYYLGTYGSWNHFGLPRSASVFENTWVKLREVSLTYTVPATWVRKTKVLQNLSVSLIGRDLFYIYTTAPKGTNPEGVAGIGNMQGIEYSSLPRIRSFGLSVKTSF